MADDISCNICGGTDFHKDAGYYYCNECQTQSQDVQERVFRYESHTEIKPKSLKRSRSKVKSAEILTSWECYNYILRGLVDELIELGANVNLKKTVHILWFKYLHQLEVTATENLPKLGALNSKLDAEILYGKPAKRKRKHVSRASTPSEVGTNDSSLSRREKSKLKRTFAKSQYDKFNASQPEESSLHNQSLTSLQSDASSKDSENEKRVKYNKYAKKELLKKMSKNHLNLHSKDMDSEHTCHKISYRSVSAPFKEGPAVLSRAKIYGVLYLALLINRDNIQLGDLIRFVREGHLSYHNVNHFLPDEPAEVFANMKTWSDHHMFLSHYRLRIVTGQLAHFLGVTSSVPVQNLIQLCRRYCHELNLPDEVWGYCINLLSRVSPKLKFTVKSRLIPNYEGRTICMIIFILKLMFGMDDKTEHYFSNRAKQINEYFEENDRTKENKKMFVWNNWLHYIHYRKLILMQHHFPTQALHEEENIQNTDLFVNFITKQNLKHETEIELKTESALMFRSLEKFKEKYCEEPQALTFGSALTPFRNYTETLSISQISRTNNYLIDTLKSNFVDDSLKFLISPFYYLKKLEPNSRIALKHRGVNSNIKLVKFRSLKTVRKGWRKRAKQKLFVNLTNSLAGTKILNSHKYTFKLEDVKTEKNSKKILENFEKLNMHFFEQHIKHTIRASSANNRLSITTNSPSSSAVSNRSMEKAKDELLNKLSEFTNETKKICLHYNPYERYFLQSVNVDHISRDEFKEFSKKFPKSFLAVLKECARVTEQDMFEIYDEFTNVEIYLCYVAKYAVSDNYRHNISNTNLCYLVDKATKNW